MKVYEDRKYETTGKLKRKSDVYSFGVVLFEIFCGRLAYDPGYTKENEKGLSTIARQCFDDGTIESIMDPKLKEETIEGISSSNRGPNQDSLDTFIKIAHQCLGEAAKRPTMYIVIMELKRAINFHVSQYFQSTTFFLLFLCLITSVKYYDQQCSFIVVFNVYYIVFHAFFN
ncbi:putative protein kinase RLK-Pelle-LRR-I-1 family [Helianthus anomalus]